MVGTFTDETSDARFNIYIDESLDWKFYTKIYYPAKPIKEVSFLSLQNSSDPFIN